MCQCSIVKFFSTDIHLLSISCILCVVHRRYVYDVLVERHDAAVCLTVMVVVGLHMAQASFIDNVSIGLC